MNHMSAITDLTEGDLSEAVRSTAMLADVTISLWGAERTDNAVMEKIKADAGAVGNVGRAIKNMLAGVDGTLKDTRSAFAAVRAQHYALTLPWVSDPHAERQRGPRLLPNMLFEKYLSEMSKRKREAMAALDKFIAEYPDLVVRAKANLGGLADANYPSGDEVRASFRVAFDFEPIPAGTSFKGLPEHMLDKLSRGLRAKQERMVDAATGAMWEEVRDRIKHIVARMADPDAKFKATTVEGVRDLITLLPGWGSVTGDPRATEITEDISRMLSGVDSETIRKNVHVRNDVAEQAQAVADKLSAWGL